MNVEQIMTLAPVIPVLVIHDVRHARPIAEALVAGGLPALEVTLRTDCALDVIREMAKVEGAVVGAGTVLNPDDVKSSVDAGARFLVSPGFTDRLANAAIGSGLPFLPGTANAGDVGLTHFKFFPAMANGGPSALKAIAAPLYMAKFCPTGGITEANAPEWLALGSVLCVGGSWVVPAGEPDVKKIEKLARAAVGLKRA